MSGHGLALVASVGKGDRFCRRFTKAYMGLNGRRVTCSCAVVGYEAVCMVAFGGFGVGPF